METKVGADSPVQAVAHDVEVQQADVTEKSYFSKASVWLTILFSGLAIGSDGYNAAVIGNVELLLALIYPEALTDTIYQRLSNAFLIGMIVGMLFFGVVVDQLGRKTGAVATTVLLVVGIVLSSAANGTSDTGLFWMLIVARGIAGVGAGGEYPVSGAGAAEATDESSKYRKQRGFMFAMLADLSASLGYVWGGLVPLLLLLCVGQQPAKYDTVWRTAFALGLAPPLVIFWFRLRMAVSTAYRKSAMRKQRVPYWLALKRYYRPLIGCATTVSARCPKPGLAGHRAVADLPSPNRSGFYTTGCPYRLAFSARLLCRASTPTEAWSKRWDGAWL